MKSAYYQDGGRRINMFFVKILTESAPEISGNAILFSYIFSERKYKNLLRQNE